MGKHYASYEERVAGQAAEFLKELVHDWKAQARAAGLDAPMTPITRSSVKALARRKHNDGGYGLVLAQFLVETGKLRKCGDIGYYTVEEAQEAPQTAQDGAGDKEGG